MVIHTIRASRPKHISPYTGGTPVRVPAWSLSRLLRLPHMRSTPPNCGAKIYNAGSFTDPGCGTYTSCVTKGRDKLSKTLRVRYWPCVTAGGLSEATEVNRPYLMNLARGWLRDWVTSCAGGAFPKTSDPNEQFDRSFSFMTVKGKSQNQNCT